MPDHPGRGGAPFDRRLRWAARLPATTRRPRPVVTDHCVRVDVSAVDPQTVLTALEHGLGHRQTRHAPAGVDRRLDTGGRTSWPPSLLADTPAVAGHQPGRAGHAAGRGESGHVGRRTRHFAALPALLREANGWADFSEPAWGQVTMALPESGREHRQHAGRDGDAGPGHRAGPSPRSRRPCWARTRSGRTWPTSAAGPPAANTQRRTPGPGQDGGIQGAPFSAVPVLEVDLYTPKSGGRR